MSRFTEKMRQTWDQNILFSVLLELTYNCNLDCDFCYNEKDLGGKALSREQYLSLFQDLRDMGVFNLILSGGEPLAHRDFFLLGSKARELGFVIRIKSNGHALHPVTAKRLKEEVDPFSIEISLHGACARTHDKQTRVPGSFDQLMKNLHTLKDLGLRFQLNSVLTCWNEDEISAMYGLAKKFEAPLKFDSQVTPRDNGDRSPLQIAPSEQGLRKLFRYQHEFTGKTPNNHGENPPPREHEKTVGLSPAFPPHPGPLPPGRGDPGKFFHDKKTSEPAARTRSYCGAGTSTIAIDPVGNVYPCVQWRRAIGNVREQRIQQIWQNNATLGHIRKTNEQAHRNVLEQGDKAAFGAFCPGMADLVSGDATAIYPSVHLRSKLQKDIVNNTEN